jgi:hypothetical protein
MSIPAVNRSNRLPILAASISDHVAAAEAATRRGLEHAIAAGLLLIEARELIAHGEWLEWLRANCPLSPRQAQTYMRLARNRHKFEAVKNAATAHLTIAAAEALVGRPEPERPHGLPGQLDMLGGPEVAEEERAVAAANAQFQGDNVTLKRGTSALAQGLRDRLELALEIARQNEKKFRGERQRAKQRVVAGAITDAIDFLRGKVSQ